MKRSTAILLFTILVGLVLILLVEVDFFERWEQDVYDILTRAGTEDQAQSDLVSIVMIDKSTLDWGRDYYLHHNVKSEDAEYRYDERAYIFNWPWNRLVYDLIIQYMAKEGAKALAFDFEFSNPYSRDDHLNGDSTLGFGTCIQNEEGNPFVIHTINFTAYEKPNPDLPEFTPLQKACLAASAITIEGAEETALPFDRTEDGPYREVFLPYSGILNEFGEAMALLRLGAVCAQPDSDSVVRRVRPFVTFQGNNYPSLGLAAALAAIESTDGAESWKLAVDRNRLVVDRKSSDDNVSLPLTPSGDVLIKWRDNGAQDITSLETGYFKVYPAARIFCSVLKEQGFPTEDISESSYLEPGLFKDKIVFLGANAPGLYDLKATPVSENYPGVKVHAALTESVLRGEAITRFGQLSRGLLAGCLAAGAALITFLVRLNVLKLASVLCISLAYLGGAAGLFLGVGYWLDTIAPLFGIALAYSSVTTYNYFTEGRRSREISRMFKHFAPPAVVQHLISHPEALFTRGEKRDITVFFSDIQSFTSISNTPEMRENPERLTDHLNAYLTEMTHAITDCGGTLDKYIGDAVVAIFGAPLPLENHALAACQAALECQRRLESFNKNAAESGTPAFVTRIGLYSGEATVGCVGSLDRFSYTAIGSTVNFASRLEGVNKVYGTLILAGDSTYQMAGESIQSRYLDEIRVPGLVEDAPPIGVYQVLAKGEETNPLDKEVLIDFERARSLYGDLRFGEAADLFDKISKKIGDRPSLVFLDRCSQFAETPPVPDWDGVFRIDSK